MRAVEILGRRSLQQTVNNLSLSISLRKTEAKKRDIAPRTQLEEWQELTKKKKSIKLAKPQGSTSLWNALETI